MWISEIQSKVFTRIKVEGTKKLKSKYPNINFTTSSKVQKDPKFPNVYLQKLAGAEQGQDLDGTTVNAVISSFQVEITDNVSEDRTQEVADVICMIMKSLGYQILGEPTQDNNESTYRNISRYRRTIGEGDFDYL